MAGGVSPSGGSGASQGISQGASNGASKGASGGSGGADLDSPKQANTFDQVLTTISTQMAQEALGEMDQAMQDTEEDSQ